jgi:hypothetical protein
MIWQEFLDDSLALIKKAVPELTEIARKDLRVR